MIKSLRKKRHSGDNSPKHSITRISSNSSPTGRLSSGSGSGSGSVSVPLASAFDQNGGASLLLQSPKKVIRALYDYEPQGPRELRFKKGDFFHVLNDDEDTIANQNGWCEATNPMTQTTGMVPMVYFEVFNRSRPSIVTDNKNNNNNGDRTSPMDRHSSSNSSNSSSGVKLRNSNQALYALTLYPFRAERDDELDVDPGENLVICAHHEYEWFIAKPINRLGGPGLVPVSYVKIIDLTNPLATSSTSSNSDEDIRKLIDNFKIPTVEQWKVQTAKYQASTIPLGSISNTSQQAPHSANSQYFENPLQQDHNDNDNHNKAGGIPGAIPNSSISSELSMASVVEASVDSYQLDHGRYQYLICAKLSNGKVRYLYRYYQDFYDLQVKLLELFPFEAGKMENLKRIIPSIPGPLINVNDHISKLRREKLDYYLKNLIALPDNISKSEEVLQLFELVENGFDREILSNESTTNSNAVNSYYPTNNNNNVISQRRRSLKPISYQSNYQQERLSQYSAYHITAADVNTPNSQESLNQSRSSSIVLANSQQTQQTQQQQATATSTEMAKVKVKFYYDEDIFVLLLPVTLRLQDLHAKLFKRLNLDEETQTHNNIHMYLKKDYDGLVEETLDIKAQVVALENHEINTDEKFGDILMDKCKVVILVA
ncbi:bud emergence protein 1 [Scheffersomyces spartinae]|uniref:Bud emergence protein 1 n=1 Tax=Scheffersomyces spartinae TaxID=45513 RepID=A0A9P7VCB4_9ASCO|nr:bud emergence protein 1 [Scheffersomyces spartinae]KAG7195100.1 bud emergence protein 1 [Scheffersomyces spartinae]